MKTMNEIVNDTALMESLKKAETAADLYTVLTDAGYSVTLEECEAAVEKGCAMAENGELDDEILDAVNGGFAWAALIGGGALLGVGIGIVYGGAMLVYDYYNRK